MTVEGASGALRYGYQEAAQLGRWTLVTSGRHQMTFRARVNSVHVLWGHRQALDLVVAFGSTEWRWDGITPVYDGQEVVVELTTHPQVTQFSRGS